MEDRKVLVLGSRGMLGQEIVRVFEEDNRYHVTAWDIEDIDITDFETARAKITALRPEIIINCIAYNAVDTCESDDQEHEKALLLNARTPELLAKWTGEFGATLVHYSTDYVFDGESDTGYAEDAEPNPISRYGKSKLMGEQQVLGQNGKNYVIRLSKLFGVPALSGVGKKSFFEKMLEAAKEKSEIAVVDDERSCFTYAPDLAFATKVLVQEEKPYGVYHMVNSGAVTWYEAAQELFRQAKLPIIVKPVSASAFPRPAKRPHSSELLNTKFIVFRPYSEALSEYLTGMVQ